MIAVSKCSLVYAAGPESCANQPLRFTPCRRWLARRSLTLASLRLAPCSAAGSPCPPGNPCPPSQKPSPAAAGSRIAIRLPSLSEKHTTPVARNSPFMAILPRSKTSSCLALTAGSEPGASAHLIEGSLSQLFCVCNERTADCARQGRGVISHKSHFGNRVYADDFFSRRNTPHSNTVFFRPEHPGADTSRRPELLRLIRMARS